MSLVSSYTVCFLQRGGVSLASSAIIYNIVKVKVTRWPVDPFDSWLTEPSTCWPFRKRTPQGQLRGPPTYTVEMWAVDPFDPSPVNPFDPLTRWPVDPSTRWPFRKRNPQGPPILHCWDAVQYPSSKRCRIRLCSCKQEEPLQRVAWGWCIYNIVESESDPLTRRAVDLFEKEPLKGNFEVHLHTPTKFGEDPSKDLGGDREQTDRQTNRQTLLEL